MCVVQVKSHYIILYRSMYPKSKYLYTQRTAADDTSCSSPRTPFIRTQLETHVISDRSETTKKKTVRFGKLARCRQTESTGDTLSEGNNNILKT